MTNELDNETADFYKDVLNQLISNKIVFMLAGTFAFSAYTGIKRPTKDLDFFCKAGDYPKILQLLKDKGYQTEITDARWLAKVWKGKKFVDLIFGTAQGVCTVDDTWVERATVTFLGYKVKIIPPEEFIWSKAYVQHRQRSESPDVNHLILKKGATLDWKRLLTRMEPHWEILLAHLLQFRFVYPSERGLVPKWILEELTARITQELDMPIPKEKICRGPLLSRDDYEIDVNKWGYKTVL